MADEKKFKKATKNEQRQRVLTIIGLMEKGWSQHRITVHCSKQWGISERHANTLYRRADDEVYENISELTRQRLYARLVHKLEAAIDMSFEQKQPAAVVGAIATLSRLTGIGTLA